MRIELDAKLILVIPKPKPEEEESIADIVLVVERYLNSLGICHTSKGTQYKVQAYAKEIEVQR